MVHYPFPIPDPSCLEREEGASRADADSHASPSQLLPSLINRLQSPQLLTHLNLTLILLDSLTNLLLTQLDPTLFLPSDELASSIYDPLSLTLPLFKTTLARALESSSSSPDQQTGFLEMQARLKELTWLIEEDKEGALWRRQKASVKAGWLHWWRCPRDTWMERDGGGKDGEDGCRQIESEDDWAVCMKVSLRRVDF